MSALLGQDLQRIGKVAVDKYHAILMDESQDFHPRWLSALPLLLAEEPNFLLLAEDPKQKIYPRNFSYIQAGIHVRGAGGCRSHTLPIGYRSTREIIIPASRLVTKSRWDTFYRDYIEQEDNLEAKENAMRTGQAPTVTVSASYSAICQHIASDIAGKRKDGYAFSDIGILYLVRATPPASPHELPLNSVKINYVAGLRAALTAEAIPYFWQAENQETKKSEDLLRDAVTITTIFSAKGLEFEAVYIVGLACFPWHKRNERENASMLYVAMMYAKSALSMYSKRDTGYVKKIQAAIEGMKNMPLA